MSEPKKAAPKKRASRAKPPEQRKRRGPPLWEPTATDRNLVKMGIAMGTTEEMLAAMLTIPGREPGIDVKTLHKYFPQEIALSKAQLELQLAGSMWQRAMGNSQGAAVTAIFLSKAKFGWKDREVIELRPPEGEAGADGAPQTFTLSMGTA
jgi:hypothetical protein